MHADDLPTENELPANVAAGRRAQQEASVSHELAVQTLRDESIDAARTMIRVGRLVGLGAVTTLPFIGGNVTLRWIVIAAVAFAIVLGVWVERRVRTRTGDSDRIMFGLALSVSPAILVQVLYFGIYSAAQLFPALALYFFSRRERFGPALAMLGANAVLQATCAALIIAGVVADPGLVRPALSPAVLIVCHALTQLGFFGAFLLGRGSYRASRDAIVRMQSATRLAAQREALLHEARADLDRALQHGGAGRFTDRVFGSYRIGQVIGRGGMGEVYEARHTDTGSAAAVKLLSQRELANPDSVARFVREVGVIRALTSPHVVRVLDASAEGEAIPYLVMERLRGDDLSHHLRGGRLPAEGLHELLRQVGAAVEEAWEHGVVHRDLKPQNLFLSDRDGAPPIWKVLDFGVAALEAGSGTLTHGKVVGTPSYMAPEQARGERVDHRADVYALAAVAYRWLTGRPVVAGRDMAAALYQTVHVMPDRPSWLADLPADVDRALALGLAKSAAARYATVGELRDALDAALDGELSSALRTRGDRVIDAHPWGAVRA